MNITEFAKVAGVSKSAVSRYFNDGYVSEEKRRRSGAERAHQSDKARRRDNT